MKAADRNIVTFVQLWEKFTKDILNKARRSDDIVYIVDYCLKIII
jgi:hypothetical protein